MLFGKFNLILTYIFHIFYYNLEAILQNGF